MWDADVLFHAFLTSVDLRLGRFISVNLVPGTHRLRRPNGSMNPPGAMSVFPAGNQTLIPRPSSP
jgi:hypothetical protein